MEPRRARLTRLLLLSVISLPISACSSAPAATPTATPASTACANVNSQLKVPGQLTFSTSDPAYNPWFEDDPAIQYLVEPTGQPNWHVTDPYSMHGFESGVAYSLANVMGFEPDHVRWVPNTRDQAQQPGAKNFDVYLAQVPIPSGGSTAVDFSDAYLDAVQAVVAEPTNPVAAAKATADLRAHKLGVIAGSPSEAMVSSFIKPDTAAQTYMDEITAAAALRRGDIDAIVTDIATAFLLLDGPGSSDPAPLPEGVVVGKFDSSAWVDHFGLVLEKGNPMLPCINAALAEIERTGSLDEFRNEDIPVGEGVPTFK